jgi:two-component system chemotaxis response regulator CheB
MKHFPLPVIVLSSLTPRNSETAIKALDLGAVDVLCKTGSAYSTQDVSRQLVQSIRAAAKANVRALPRHGTDGREKLHLSNDLLTTTTHQIIAVGASTGGTKAIESVLRAMPAGSPGTVIVQHMPESFTKTFAERLNSLCPMEVREANDNDHVVPGCALVAPGNRHMVLQRSGGNYLVRIKGGPRVHYQRPSVDVMFQSVAKHAGRNAVGVILTGMGADGAKGMLAMQENGAYNISQDEQSCVVFGMPKEAIKLGGVNEVKPLPEIPKAIFNALARNGSAS